MENVELRMENYRNNSTFNFSFSICIASFFNFNDFLNLSKMQESIPLRGWILLFLSGRCGKMK